MARRAYAQLMRRFAIVMALVVGFAAVSGQFSTHTPADERAGAEIRVLASGALTGITVGLGDLFVDGMLDRGDAERLRAERQRLHDFDWFGRLAGFAVLAWFAWQWFGRSKTGR